MPAGKTRRVRRFRSSTGSRHQWRGPYLMITACSVVSCHCHASSMDSYKLFLVVLIVMWDWSFFLKCRHLEDICCPAQKRDASSNLVEWYPRLITFRSHWVSTHGQRIIYLHSVLTLCSYCKAFMLRGKCKLHPCAMPYLKFDNTWLTEWNGEEKSSHLNWQTLNERAWLL